LTAARRLAGLLCAVVVCHAARVIAAEPPLQDLARQHVAAGQGVYAVAGDGTVLVAQAENRAVHPASVTKIATALALLEQLGPQYRFTTRVRGARPGQDGVVEGNLVVEATGDPFFVDEGAFLLLQRLRALGVRRVTGSVVVAGPLLFDWQPDPDGKHLRRVLGGQEGAEAWAAVSSGAAATPLSEAALHFDGHGGTSATGETLAVHRSPPLLHVVKVLGGYSNNVFHYASDAIGGPVAVQRIARLRVPNEMREEIVIENGAGAGTTNRISPRAAVALLDALAEELAKSSHGLTDALPVSGIDPGTLQDRFPETRGFVVGKTGTFGSVGASALAGALRTKRYGTVRFAVLNHGIAVPEARAMQDAFVRALIAATDAQAWPYATPTRPAYLDAEVE
jgi:D-alanyl-D-alanine carboxypeptidase/D-alanyl-D-alanine-endopeptidase (penicillin-binding protein 4)